MNQEQKLLVDMSLESKLKQEIEVLQWKNDFLVRKIEVVEKKLDNVRKGLFARHSELIKMYSETAHKLETLERDLARNGYEKWVTGQFQRENVEKTEDKIVMLKAL